MTQTAPGPFPLGFLCPPPNRLQYLRAAEATKDSGGRGQWEPTDGVSGAQGLPPQVLMAQSCGPGLRLGGVTGLPTCWAQVQPGLAGSELSTLLTGGTEEGEGERGRAPVMGGGWGCPATTMLPRMDS